MSLRLSRDSYTPTLRTDDVVASRAAARAAAPHGIRGSGAPAGIGMGSDARALPADAEAAKKAVANGGGEGEGTGQLGFTPIYLFIYLSIYLDR